MTALLRETLLRMEQACEQLAATRSHAIYTAGADGRTPSVTSTKLCTPGDGK
jgi:hypothetical protein